MSIYNEPLKYIKSSIDSILSQTLKNFEFIIVIDNPDREDVYDILQTYLASDARVKVLSNERNMGLAYSLNKAIKYSVGNYIFRMDADDISYPERFEKQINFMEKYRLDFSATLIEVMDEDEETLYKQKNINKNYFSEDIYRMLSNRCVLSHPTWCVKRAVFLRLDGYRNIVPAEDYDFLLRLALSGIKCGLIGDILLRYRSNANGISQTNQYKQYIYAAILQDWFKNGQMLNVDYIPIYLESYINSNKFCQKHLKKYLDFKFSSSPIAKKVFWGRFLFFKYPFARRLIIQDFNIYKIKILNGKRTTDDE